MNRKVIRSENEGEEEEERVKALWKLQKKCGRGRGGANFGSGSR